ncbi:unnamed protein product [Prunus armeniaca]
MANHLRPLFITANFGGVPIPKTHGILDVDVIVGTKKLKIAFFVVDTTSTTYNALLSREWIHQSLYVPSTLHQQLALWHEEGFMEIVKADPQPFLPYALCFEARYYHDDLGPFTFFGVNQNDRPHGVAAQKLIEECMASSLEDWNRPCVLNLHILKRKTGAVRICVDYRNLNEASLKDEYPMPMADMLVDGAAHNQMLSFMDGNAGYNQIMVVEEDIQKTAFMHPGHIGAFEYTVMPFGLRNAGATYQRAMNSVFHDMIEVSIGSLQVQDNKEGKEQIFTAIKLRHYMIPFTTYIIAKTDLIKYMLTRSMLRGRIGKWTLAVLEFASRYVPQKSIKGQAVADFLADHPGEEIENMDSMDIANADLLTRAQTCLNNPIYSVHLTPRKLYFGGSKTNSASGAGIVLEDLLGIKHCYSFKLDFQCTNNKAEYEALIIGVEMLVELGIQSI